MYSAEPAISKSSHHLLIDQGMTFQMFQSQFGVGFGFVNGCGQYGSYVSFKWFFLVTGGLYQTAFLFPLKMDTHL